MKLTSIGNNSSSTSKKLHKQLARELCKKKKNNHPTKTKQPSKSIKHLITAYLLLPSHMLSIKTYNSKGSLGCFLYFHILIWETYIQMCVFVSLWRSSLCLKALFLNIYFHFWKTSFLCSRILLLWFVSPLYSCL